MSNIFIVAFVLSPIVIQAIECNSVQQTDQAETRLIDLFVHIVNTKITNIKSYYEQLNTHHLADHDYNNDSDNVIQNRTIPALLNLNKLNTPNDVNEKSQSNSPTSRDNFLVLLLNPNFVLNQSQIDNLRAQYERSLANTYQLERVLYAFAYSLIIVSSFFGNLLVCRVCLLNMSRTNALIMSLAVSDLAMTIFNIPFNYFRLLNYSWPFGSVICFVVNFVQHLVVYCSSYTMAIIAIQRYYSVCCLFPFQSKNKSRRVSFQNKYDNICSMRTIVVAILITWTVSAVISTFFTFNSTMVVRKDTFAFILAMYILKLNKQQAPLAVQPESVLLGRNFNQTKEHLATVHNFITYRCANLVPDSVEQFVQEHFSIKADFAKSIAVFATQYFIPLFVSCCLYIRIGKTISRQGKMANSKENPKSQMVQKMKRRRICMLVLVVALFAICWLPLHTFHLLTDAGLVNFNYQIFMMVHWIAMSSVCYNPFIYCWLNKNFRNGAIRVFCGCCQTRAGKEIRTTNGNRTSTTIDISEINRSSFELTKLPNGIQEKLLKQVGLLKPPSHIRSGNAITGTTTSITITTSTNNQIGNANHERHNSLLITDL